MKRFLILVAVAWIMVVMAWASKALAAADTTVMYVHVREGTMLNGRREPSVDSPIVMRMERGFAVDVLSVKNGWARIIGSESGTCWCSVDYLASYHPDGKPVYGTVVSNGRVRIRQSPDGETVGYVRNGDQVEVRFRIDGWAYIGSGYVMTEFLEKRE